MTKLLLPPALLVLVILVFITISRQSNLNYPASLLLPTPQPAQNFGEIIDQKLSPENKKNQIQFSLPKEATKHSDINVPILTYHYVGGNPNPNDKARNSLSVDPFQFEQELTWLVQNGYQSVTLKDLYNNLTLVKPLPSKPIILSFDDGYIDFYYNAYPILRKYNFEAVSFIPTGLVGKPAYMTWSMIEEISKLGGVEFESHGVNHRGLTSLSDRELLEELEGSRKVLESHTGKQVDFIAYPYGSFDLRVTGVAQKVGYKAAASTIFGDSQSKDWLFALRRIKVPGMSTLPVFASRLRQAS
jgi:peptidoglycan/xylan/chitin deacetylase (PgdA/CDA1 family)